MQRTFGKDQALVGWAIMLYLVAIVLANYIVGLYGPAATIPVAFFYIGLDLTLRDFLHNQWGSGRLWKMGYLIVAGSLISWLMNRGNGQIALASTAAFFSAALVDTLVYSYFAKAAIWKRINFSNVASGLVDSLVFIIVAFGWPPLWWIVLAQWLAKMVGGFIWSLFLIDRMKRREADGAAAA